MVNLSKKISFYIGIIYFSFLLKRGKLVSSESEFFSLRKFVKKDQNVIDIGANIGRYSFELSKIIGKRGLVYAFEPMQKSYLTLLSLIIFNNFKNILSFNLALSDKSNFVRMKEFSSTSTKYFFSTQTESRIIKNKKDSTIKYSIKLDDMKIKKKISFIKIDCEGHEIQTIKGARNLIRKNKPIILVEDLENKMIRFLNSIDYKEIINKKESRNRLFVHKKNHVFKNSI